MSIFNNHLKYQEFVSNEIKSLGFIQNLSTISQNYPRLSSQASINCGIYKGHLKNMGYDELSFEFQCEFQLVIEKKLHNIVLEAVVKPEFALASYSFAICSINNNIDHILRKFHFDFAVPLPNQQTKPIYHLQYGGDKLYSKNICVDHLYPWLSNPRLFSTPMNLAILLDLVFFEFKNENIEAHKLVERKEWRDFITENENKILKPFYKTITEFFRSDHKSDYLLRDFYYGKS